jgi:hypothetical protein
MGGKLIDDTYLEMRSWIGGSRFRGSSTEYSNLIARYNNYDILDSSDAITTIEVRREERVSRILKSYFPLDRRGTRRHGCSIKSNEPVGAFTVLSYPSF